MLQEIQVGTEISEERPSVETYRKIVNNALVNLALTGDLSKRGDEQSLDRALIARDGRVGNFLSAVLEISHSPEEV